MPDKSSRNADQIHAPWLPEPGDFKLPMNFVSRTSRIALIAKWVEGGAIEGSTADLSPAPILWKAGRWAGQI